MSDKHQIILVVPDGEDPESWKQSTAEFIRSRREESQLAEMIVLSHPDFPKVEEGAWIPKYFPEEANDLYPQVFNRSQSEEQAA